jgi:predicted nuclease of predicted toxin-antitoxin system
MRVLLDECVPKRLRKHLSDHHVVTVVEMGWSGVKNGKLLALAAAEFDCFLTVDAKIEYQQHIQGLPVAILLVRAVKNDIETIQPMASEIRQALAGIQPRQFLAIGAEQTHAASRDT